MDLQSNTELGNLTLKEATSLSRALEEHWGLRPASEREQGDFVDDFLIPLVHRFAGNELGSPQEHLAALRASLARATAK